MYTPRLVILLFVVLPLSQVLGQSKVVKIPTTLKYRAVIYSEMSVLSPRIDSLSAGTKVDVVGYVHRSQHWKVRAGEKSGYVLGVNLVMLDTLTALKEKKRLEYRLSLKSSYNEIRRLTSAYYEAHRKFKTEQDIARIREAYGPASANKIVAGRVWNGMTRQMTVESWGEPNYIAKRRGPSGIIEQWAYDPTHFLFFDERKVQMIAKQIKSPKRWILFSEHSMRVVPFDRWPTRLPYPE